MLYQDLHLLPSTASRAQFLLQQTAACKVPLDLFLKNLLLKWHCLQLAQLPANSDVYHISVLDKTCIS